MKVFAQAYIPGVALPGQTVEVPDAVALSLLAENKVEAVGSDLGNPVAASTSRGAIGAAELPPRLVVCNIGPIAANSLSNGTDTTKQSRIAYTVAYNCSGIVLSYGNFATASTTDVETKPGNTVTVTASIEVGGVTYRAMVGANAFGIEPDGGSFDFDPIMVDLAEGDVVQILTCKTVTSGQKFALHSVCQSTDSYETNTADRTGTAGQMASAGAGQGTIIVGPLAVRGITDRVNPPSLVILGDSIPAGVDDISPKSGWVNRGLLAAAATGKRIPWLNVSTGGTKLSTRSDFKLTQARTRTYGFGKHTLVLLGTNDLPAGDLNAMVANAVKLGRKIRLMGSIPHIGTLYPRSWSSNNWTTADGQGPVYDATRVPFNDILRNGLSPYESCLDVASWCEVNSNNVLTINGGRWLTRSSAPVYTGTATQAGTTTLLTDAAKAFGNVKGFVLRMTSGALAGQGRIIVDNTATTITLFLAFGSAIANGDTYEIWDASTVDGVHPTRSMATYMGSRFATDLDRFY